MKEDFDDILRKKWEEKHFPVDPSHRADMVRLLDQNNRRRTGVLWWFFGAGIAVTVVALFVILNNAERLENVSPVDNATSIELKAQAEAEAKDANDAQAKNEAQEESKAVAEAHAFANKAQDSQMEAAGENEGEIADEVEKLRHAKKDEIKADAKAMLRPANPHPGATAQQPAKAEAEAKAKEINNTDPNDEHKTQTSSKAANKKKEQTITVTDVIDKSGDDKNELNINSSNPPDNTVIVSSAETKENSVTVVLPIEVESTNNPVGGTNENTPLVVRNDFITDPIDALAFGNLDFSRNNEPGKVDPIIVKHHPVWLYAEAGMGFVPAAKANIKTGYTMRGGAGVGYGLNTRQSLTLSGGYMMQKNGFDFQRSSTVQLSSFGARSNFNTLTPDRLHFVYARLGLHHRIKRHMISVFGGGQYLYGAQGTVVVKSDDQLTGISETTKYAWLKLDGMNQLWWNAELNYGYQLTPRLSIQAGVKYNFTSIVAQDQALEDEGYYWKGDLSSLSPSFTINYHLYGKR